MDQRCLRWTPLHRHARVLEHLTRGFRGGVQPLSGKTVIRSLSAAVVRRCRCCRVCCRPGPVGVRPVCSGLQLDAGQGELVRGCIEDTAGLVLLPCSREGPTQEKGGVGGVVVGEEVPLGVHAAQERQGLRGAAGGVEPAGAQEGQFDLVLPGAADDGVGQFCPLEGVRGLRSEVPRGDPCCGGRLGELSPEDDVVRGGEGAAGAGVAARALGVVAAQEGDVADGGVGCALQRSVGFVLCQVCEDAAVVSGFLEVPGIGEGVDEGPEGLQQHWGPGQGRRGCPHGLACVLDGVADPSLSAF
ncbi:hypothetical protein ACVWWH_003952 [Sinomonas sp. RB5]